MKRLLLGLALLVCAALPASAQQGVINYCYNPYASAAPNAWTPCNPPSTFVATGTTGAVVATFTVATGHTGFLCGFSVNAVGTGAVGPITITGLLGGTQTWQLTATAAGAFLNQTFTPCIPTSAAATNIVITTTADASASAVDANGWGYVQ